MRLRSIGLLALGAAGGFAVAQRLLSDDGIPEQVPPEVRARLEGVRGRLQRVRERATEGLREARVERDAAREALMHEYHEATKRDG